MSGGGGLHKVEKSQQEAAVCAAQQALWSLVMGRFRELERDHGLKQADLARRLGLSRPQVHAWLSDPNNLTIKAAVRLLAAMGAGLAYGLKPLDEIPLSPAAEAAGEERPSRPNLLVLLTSACASGTLAAQAWIDAAASIPVLA